jgi:hypothetical protein
MAQVVMALIPLLTFYNPDEARVRKPVEDEKFVATLDELAQLTHEGGVLRIYRDGNVRGAWWDRGLVDHDVHAVLEIDFEDSEPAREKLETYVRTVLRKRFRQKAMYVKYVLPMERLVVTEVAVKGDEPPGQDER